MFEYILFRLRYLFAKKPKMPDLYFKSPEEALEFVDKFGNYQIEEGKTVDCIVDTIQYVEMVGWSCSIRTPDNINRIAVFAHNHNYQELIGSLCAALIGKQVPFGPRKHTFIVIAELEPTFTDTGWKVVREL